MRSWSALVVLPALLFACGGDKSDISLSVLMTDESVKVSDGAFGALSGGFELRLELGGYSSGSTQVSLGNFSLETEAGAPLVEILDLEPSVSFPINLDAGDAQSVVFQLSADGVDRDALCAGRVRIVGSLLDTLKGGTEPVRSATLTPDCG